MNKTIEALKRVEVWVESLTGLHTDVRQEQGEILAAIREALAEPVCEHRIADARNEFVRDGYICIKCGALFRAADHAEPVKQEPVAWMNTNGAVNNLRKAGWAMNTAPVERQWVDLTDDEIGSIYEQHHAVGGCWTDGFDYERAVIAAFKEKNK